MPRLNAIDRQEWLGSPLAANTDGGLVKMGTSSARIVQDTANYRFLNYNFDNGATSGDSRGMYLRQFITGAGGGGDTARIFATVEDVAANTVRGAHISLNFGSTGTVTGLGVALECTLHIANQATQGGTMSPLKVAIHSDGATSDPSGSLLSYINVVNQGNTTGDDDVDTDAHLFNITGHAAGTGTFFQTVTTGYVLGEITNSIKINVGGTVYHLLASTLGAQAT